MPNLNSRFYILRPVMADPPLCRLADLKTVLTLNDLADLHEICNLRELIREKSKPEKPSG
ncbi:MAG: hypothetical protein KDJ69_04555 [Nitratireductor sp.]|nr:hypothetical protein [Nitratireductor sp.]